MLVNHFFKALARTTYRINVGLNKVAQTAFNWELSYCGWGFNWSFRLRVVCLQRRKFFAESRRLDSFSFRALSLFMSLHFHVDDLRLTFLVMSFFILICSVLNLAVSLFRQNLKFVLAKWFIFNDLSDTVLCKTICCVALWLRTLSCWAWNFPVRLLGFFLRFLQRKFKVFGFVSFIIIICCFT